MRELRAIARLLGLIQERLWAVPVIVGLGLLAALLEGFGLYLFVPLLETLLGLGDGDWTSNPVLDVFDGLFRGLQIEVRARVILVCMVAIIIMKNLITYVESLFWTWLEAQINFDLQMRMFDQLLDVGAQHLDGQSPGALLNTFETQSWNAIDALSALLAAIIDVLALIFFFVLLLLLSWNLTLVVALGILLISLVVHSITRRVDDIGSELVAAEGNYSVRLWDSLNGMRTIRAFGREAYERKRYADAAQKAIRLGVRREVFASAAGPMSEILTMILIGGIIFSTAAVDTALLPAVATFILILHRLLPRAQALIATRVQLLGELGAIDNVMVWLDRSDKSYVVSGTIPFHALRSGIELVDVSFHYRPGDRAALRDISLAIRKGETVALVGPSGSGKSTVINLLCRFYDPDAGDIIIDGVKLPQLDLADWRRRCAIVSQNVHLFDGTISENIAYGRLDAAEEEVIDAAKRANAHGFISERPQQYATLVGDNGLRLSGGQRQRIALARAIIRDPELLILDEATNALDNISEDLVQEALDLFGHSRTVLIIAHRLSTVRRADRIFVLDQGEIIDAGDFATLQQRNPLFSRLCLP